MQQRNFVSPLDCFPIFRRSLNQFHRVLPLPQPSCGQIADTSPDWIVLASQLGNVGFFVQLARDHPTVDLSARIACDHLFLDPTRSRQFQASCSVSPRYHSAPLTAQCALPPISSLDPPNCEWSLGFVDPLSTSLISTTIGNMDTSSCCCLSSGVAVVCVEPADLCAAASLAISQLSTLSLVGNGIRFVLCHCHLSPIAKQSDTPL
ncbi:hypothetical protein BLNAU_21759 [Blattamonas nauphoetae]|uniref:Uncharacterized protein n=1 Tax=Blattamonas nauphoetae TaxID=2049346 RepID=A0ABQ9WV07_9EUKA|nr:hypothetical protein BLNAU_21759 [Blattamonas nauphoetae]